MAPFIKLNFVATAGNPVHDATFDVEKDFLKIAEDNLAAEDSVTKGTVFLGEVAELDLGWQLKFVPLFQEESSFGKGAAKSFTLRLLCASSRQLEQESELGNLRQDFFYCISAVSLYLPPLRERREDIPQLVGYFAGLYNKKFGRDTRPPSSRLIQLLQQQAWPGNIRELENVMKRYVLFGSEDLTSGELLDCNQARLSSPPPPQGSISLKSLTRRATHELERKIILRTLRDNHWNRKKAAQALNISYRALLYKIKEAGVPPKRPRPAEANVSAVSRGLANQDLEMETP